MEVASEEIAQGAGKVASGTRRQTYLNVRSDMFFNYSLEALLHRPTSPPTVPSLLEVQGPQGVASLPSVCWTAASPTLHRPHTSGADRRFGFRLRSQFYWLLPADWSAQPTNSSFTAPPHSSPWYRGPGEFL